MTRAPSGANAPARTTAAHVRAVQMQTAWSYVPDATRVPDDAEEAGGREHGVGGAGLLARERRASACPRSTRAACRAIDSTRRTVER